MDRLLLRKRHDLRQLRVFGIDQTLVAARDHGPVGINDADLSVCGGLHLLNDVGKYMIHHAFTLQYSIFHKRPNIMITDFKSDCKPYLSKFQKKKDFFMQKDRFSGIVPK